MTNRRAVVVLTAIASLSSVAVHTRCVTHEGRTFSSSDILSVLMRQKRKKRHESSL